MRNSSLRFDAMLIAPRSLAAPSVSGIRRLQTLKGQTPHETECRRPDGPHRAHQHPRRFHLCAACWRRRSAATACPIIRLTSSRWAAKRLVAPVQLLTVRDEPGDHFTLGEPKREPLNGFRRGAAAPGSAVRPRLHHLDAFARAHPPQDAGRQRSGLGAQRAGKIVRDELSAADAADADLARPRRDQRVPRSSTAPSS